MKSKPQMGRYPCTTSNDPFWHVAQIAFADLDIPIIGQLEPTELPLGGGLEPGPLEVVRLNAALGRGPLRQ